MNLKKFGEKQNQKNFRHVGWLKLKSDIDPACRAVSLDTDQKNQSEQHGAQQINQPVKIQNPCIIEEGHEHHRGNSEHQSIYLFFLKIRIRTPDNQDSENRQRDDPQDQTEAIIT